MFVHDFDCQDHEHNPDEKCTPRNFKNVLDSLFETALDPDFDPHASMGGKLDAGKFRLDLIPLLPMQELSRVYEFGSKKYSMDGWRDGMSWRRIIAALLRHALMYSNGETLDEEMGISHMAAVAWNAFALLEYEATHPELDDRYLVPGDPSPADLAEMQDEPEGFCDCVQPECCLHDCSAVAIAALDDVIPVCGHHYLIYK